MSATPPALDAALNFSPADLVANRDGHLSDAQVARLRAARQRAALVGAAVLVVVVLLATTALFLGQVNRQPVATFVGVAITVCGAVISGMLVRNWYRLTSDMERRTVQTLAGPVEHTVRVAGRSATYVLKVDGQALVVPKPVFLAVRNGASYRFYRAPLSRVLLSAEPA